MDDLLTLHEHGIFLRREAIALGYLDRDLHRARSEGRLVRVRQGAYVDSARWSEADPVARHVLHCHAVLLSHRAPIAMSHASGAAVHGVRLWGADLSKVHATRLTTHASRKHHDVSYHDGASPTRIVERQGLPALTAAECALGTARLSTLEAGVVALDSVLQLGLCSLDELRTAYDQVQHWPGTARLQVALRLADGRAESVGESRARVLFRNHGIPCPVLQYRVVHRGRLVGVSDFAWPDRQLLGEFDGFVKYDDPRGARTPAEAVFREKRREDRLREVTGWRVIRFTWADLEDGPATAHRLRRALAGAA